MKRTKRALETQQRKMADWLNRRTENLPKKRAKGLLFAFCLVVGLHCVYLIVNAIVNI
ncbi:hypothetical protein [Sphingobacterium thalpophilum]|uniref:Uncharacterized protein n=1 Tax=Sphingobacterium thalpophilum TaxID=259 RepID=A0A4U9V8G1_9SPHI|nr:hypothetical protein [Sphingobacterium thalpophilum]VTR41212.1 Uncharacterised protein [Sphingobacterium thalpophilum]